MKKLYIVIVILLFAIRIWQSSGCKNFLPFKFSPLDVKISVEEQVNLDKDINRQTARFFHNKASTGAFKFAKSYSEVIDTKVLLAILGPLGIILIVLAIVYTAKNLKVTNATHLLLVLASILFANQSANSKFSFFMLTASLYSFSMWGLNVVEKNKYLTIIFPVLVLITLWFFAFDWQMKAICNEIFFN